MVTQEDIDLTGRIIDYEEGELDDNGIISLFAELVRTGLAWKLQGSYGRTATDLIRQGLISTAGEILVVFPQADVIDTTWRDAPPQLSEKLLVDASIPYTPANEIDWEAY